MGDIQKVKKNVKELIHLCGKRTGGEADVSGGTGWSSSVSFEEGKLKTIKSSQSSSMALRIIDNGRVGVSGSTKIDKTEVDKIIKDALAVGKLGLRAEFKLPPPTTAQKKVKLYDDAICNFNEDKFISLGEKIIQEVGRREPAMKVNSVGFGWGWGESVFINSRGIDYTQKGSSISFGLEISKIKEGDFFQLSTGQTSRRGDINFTKLTDELLEKAKWGRRIAKIKAGKYPVIFAPEAVPAIVAYFLTNLSGKVVNEGSSKFNKKLGEKMFDKRLSIIDDPTLDYYPASCEFDDEGVSSYRKLLIEKGCVKNFYYDLQEAARGKTKSTGSGSRGGMFSQAAPSVSNIVIPGGNKNYKDLIKGIKEGILAYQFLGAGQDNPYNGDFQLGLCAGYKIENGEVVGRLKNVSVSGNVFELLRNSLIWISRETQRWGSFSAPHICLNDVVVLSK